MSKAKQLLSVGEKVNISKIVRDKIMELMDNGFHDKQEIYNIIEKELGVDRPVIRREARHLRLQLLRKISILSGSFISEKPNVVSSDPSWRFTSEDEKKNGIR